VLRLRGGQAPNGVLDPAVLVASLNVHSWMMLVRR
jgi:hypothetical protein